MYSKEYLCFVAKQHLPVQYHNLIEKLSDLIPGTDTLDNNLNEIATKLDCKIEDFEEFIRLLFEVKIVEDIRLIAIKGNKLIFDYPERDVKYIRHFRSAGSNLGLLNDF